MWPVPESQTVYDGMARQPGPLALRAIGDSLPSSTSSPTYHAAREDTCKPTREPRAPIKIRYIFSARGTPVLRFRPGNDKYLSPIQSHTSSIVDAIANSYMFRLKGRAAPPVEPLRRRGLIAIAFSWGSRFMIEGDEGGNQIAFRRGEQKD